MSITSAAEGHAARAPQRDPMRPRPFRVIRVSRDARDVATMTLEPFDGHAADAFAPGQFNMLYAFGVGEVPISISGNPHESDRLVHTIRRVGLVTKALCGVQRGEAVGVRGPFGRGWPAPREMEHRDVVVVSGGIGLAPLRPVLYELLANRRQYGRVSLLYGTRTPEDILYRKELERWRGRFDVDVEVTVDRGDAGWRGHVGVVTTLIHRVPFDPATAIAMVCGPAVMMRFAATELIQTGLEAERIYISMERNMHCGIGLCGHCQYGPWFICKDGPVMRYDQIQAWLDRREV
ncbi:MAG TPA: Ni/Fe hydrogenase subunit gamma [Candidatus Omnitrophica bacterium]|nr:Ni/Fe hydrogenase subunit gamma [Candidatus Omnitrophota bacterium]